MITLAELLGGEAPLIAVSVTDSVDSAAVDAAAESGAQVAELRIDRYRNVTPDAVVKHARQVATSLPALATIRSQPEGGEWTKTDEQRLELFNAVLPEVGGADIELSSATIRYDVVEAAHRLNKIVIASYHNFTDTPPHANLESLVSDAHQLGADYVKIATMAHSLDDVRRLAEFTLKRRKTGVIVIAMGPVGISSRIFFPALGSRLTYAALKSGGAPGQLDFATTAELMRTFYPTGAR